MRHYFIALTAAALTGCSNPDSEYAVISERDYPSPDGKHIATVLEDTHFNTTGNEVSVSLRSQGQTRPRDANVTSFEPGALAVVKWSSPTALTVYFEQPSKGSVRAATNIDGVTITFKEAALR